MNRKLIAIVCLIMLVALSGCGAGNSIPKGNGADAEGTAAAGDGSSADEQRKTATLYFGSENADALVPEEREILVKGGETEEKVLFEELQKGPSGRGLPSPIPEGTRLLSASTEGDTCTIDLSREFIDNHPGGSAGELMTIYSIVNTMTQLDNVKKVRFLIEGEKRDIFIHSELDAAFERDESMIYK
ncbi:sporulation and spore germination protein [Anaerobacterium chartisolvens]|uniref:Sporulation and spore germination protein n=1 Tax=Anaerobacterium chartisolvens TaxID=1297424 RepID=A0A369B8Q5_9FIRM|nr:GerMN domain-containing protein [Anaerobacterium chartisolvens]RCX16917.1 sporulation and spore germination protein [Anaerobacterium chartisolvens]